MASPSRNRAPVLPDSDAPSDPRLDCPEFLKPGAREVLPDLLALAMLLGSLWMALETTRGLTWPPRPDFYREIGTVQQILEGRALEDPVYLGEARWYNPLVPYLLAVAAIALDTPIYELVVRFGPYFNLLCPIAFYLLVSRVLFGRWIGVAALAVYLFAFSPFLPPSVEGTYSPWLWTRNFMQGPVYGTAAALVMSTRSSRWVPWSLLSGIGLGLVFLGHTAPALVLVVFTLGWTLRSLVTNPAQRRAALLRLAIVGFTSLVVSLPFLLPLWLRYQMNVLNELPMLHVGLPIRQMALGMISLSSAMAGLGVLALWRTRDSLGISRRSRDELLGLLLAVLVCLGYGVAHQLLKHVNVVIPQVVPAFHFHLYYKAFEAIVAGLGFAYLAQRLTPPLLRFVQSRRGSNTATPGLLSERFVFCSLVALLIALQIDTFDSNYDRVLFREEAIRRAERRDMIEVYHYALEHADSQDVFLCDEDFAMFALSPAARKVIVAFAVYSNPYVPYLSRRRDRDRLYASIRENDVDSFLELADSYSVKYVIDADRSMDCCALDDSVIDAFAALERVFRRNGVGLYRVAAPADLEIETGRGGGLLSGETLALEEQQDDVIEICAVSPGDLPRTLMGFADGRVQSPQGVCTLSEGDFLALVATSRLE